MHHQPAQHGQHFRPFSFLVVSVRDEQVNSCHEPHQLLHFGGHPKPYLPLIPCGITKSDWKRGTNHRILQWCGLEGSLRVLQCS